MPVPRPPRRPRPRSLLGRLLRDRAANTLVIMAMALIPISALAGSAIDIARLHVVKARLQQACDAGVLAGRKFMSATDTAATLDSIAADRAHTFFANNFTAGWLDTRDVRFAAVKTSDSQVSGTASALVPMTVTRMFAAPDTVVAVACKARYDVADTDIVFVLDTTGSMACRPEEDEAQCVRYVRNNPARAYTRPSADPTAMGGYPGTAAYAVPESTVGNGSRIRALRQAVKDFHATIAASADRNTRIRYGFVTYTSTVNAGKAIADVSRAYLVGGSGRETWDYQTRRVTGDDQVDRTMQTVAGDARTCTGTTRTPALSDDGGYRYDSATGQARIVTLAWNGQRQACERTTQVMQPLWTWERWPLDVSGYVTGASVADPTRVRGETTRWEGCIEERRTESGTTRFTAASYDLDPDLIPTADAATRWRPMWPAATWPRWDYFRTVGAVTRSGDSADIVPMDQPRFTALGFYSCGKPIRRLGEMTAQDVAAYVDAADFRPMGGTYHDIGMIWGVRLLSARGIFAADNAGRAGQPAPAKVIVFLTDGDMQPTDTIYGLYGVERTDRRVAGVGTADLKAYHNARFLHMCRAARERRIDVWTVAIGLRSTPELTACASNAAQALDTTTGSGLSAIFQQIARQVAMLRIDR